MRPLRHARGGAEGEGIAASPPDRYGRSAEVQPERNSSAQRREGVAGQQGQKTRRLGDLDELSRSGTAQSRQNAAVGDGTGPLRPRHRLPLGFSAPFTAQLLAQENTVSVPASDQARLVANLAAYEAAAARGRQYFGPQMPFTLRV